MLINLDFFLEVIFDFTLFFLFVIVVNKLFVLYLLPFLRMQIKEIKKNQANINEKVKLLDASKSRLEFQILEQKSRFTRLDESVKLWYESVKQDNKDKMEKISKRIEKIKIKRQRQKEHFCLFRLEKNVISQAIYETYCDLSPIHNKKRGRVLLGELIDKISISLKENGIKE